MFNEMLLGFNFVKCKARVAYRPSSCSPRVSGQKIFYYILEKSDRFSNVYNNKSKSNVAQLNIPCTVKAGPPRGARRGNLHQGLRV